MDRVLRAILRTELPFFIRKVFATISPGETYFHNWHVDAIAHQLMRVHSGESRRLLINQPPRSLKSICVSVAYVAWLLGHEPTRRVIVASYSGDFAMPRGMTRPIGVKPEGSKVDRMATQSAKIEAGHVHLPNSAPWLGDFLTELLSFPNGRHDDQVDSVSQFLRWLQNDAY